MDKVTKNKGFTLVELLVVVAIIAILSTIGLTLFTTAQSNARDARRRSEVKAIVAALESKKLPGTLFYQPVTTGDFSENRIPADTTPAQYCIKLYTAEDGARTDSTNIAGTAFTAGADGTGTGSICPANYKKASTDQAFQPLTTSAVPFSAAASPFAADKRSFRICTKLENTASASGPSYGVGAFCVNSAQ